MGRFTLVPFSKVLFIRIPLGNVRFIWNRPGAVLAISPDGQEQVIRVQDITRLIQWSLLAIGILGSILVWIYYRTTERRDYVG